MHTALTTPNSFNCWKVYLENNKFLTAQENRVVCPVQEMQHISGNCGRDGIRLNQREELAAPKLAREPTEGWSQSGVRTPWDIPTEGPEKGRC